MKKISIIAPIYNEEGNIYELHQQLNDLIQGYQNKYNFKIIFVNDGSSDNSHKNILQIKDEKLSYLKFSKNYGKEAALIAGIDYAKKINSDACIIIDSDLEMPIKYIKDMIDLWEKNIKLVITKRVSKRNTSKIKTFLAKKYYELFKKITKQNIVQDALDFGLMDK